MLTLQVTHATIQAGLRSCEKSNRPGTVHDDHLAVADRRLTGSFAAVFTVGPYFSVQSKPRLVKARALPRSISSVR